MQWYLLGGQSWWKSNANLFENDLALIQLSLVLYLWGKIDLSRLWVCQECTDYICRLKTQTHSTKGVVNISASGLANCFRGVGSIGRQEDEYSEFLLPGCHWGISYLSGISPFCLTWGVSIAKCDKGRLAGHQSWIVQICYLTPNTFFFLQ